MFELINTRTISNGIVIFTSQEPVFHDRFDIVNVAIKDFTL